MFGRLMMLWMFCGVPNVFAANDDNEKHHMEKHRITVLEFTGGSVDKAILSSLTDEARVALLEDLNMQDFIILTHENTLTILSDMGLDASALDGRDAVDIGRNIHVEYIITGTVAQVGKTYVLSLKLYDTNSAQMLYATHVETKRLSRLYRKVYKVTQKAIDEHLILEEDT